MYDRWLGDASGDMYEFIQFLRHRARGTIVEIGVRGGVSTAALLLGLESDPAGHLCSIDIDAKCGELFEHPQWTFIHADSWDIGKAFSQLPRAIDILLIDGDHTAPTVDSDLDNYSRLVRKGGMILMHDIVPPPNVTPQIIAGGWGTEDVRSAYHRFIRETGYTHFELPGKYGMGVIYV